MTQRTRRIIHLLSLGKRHGEIAAELGIKPATVDTDLARARRLLECGNDTQLAIAVLKKSVRNLTES